MLSSMIMDIYCYKIAFNIYLLFSANDYHNTDKAYMHYSWVRDVDEKITQDYRYSLALVVKADYGESKANKAGCHVVLLNSG